MLSISRTLCDVQENGLIAYLTVAELLGSKAEAARLKSNLTVGQRGIGTHEYHALINLPVECYEDETSWATELRELKRLLSWADLHDKDVPDELLRRQLFLQQAPANGLFDGLFWPTLSGEVLKLRSDFSLVPNARREPAALQADLFVVISIVLTQLRQNSDSARRLSYNAYERAVLAPSNFDRFNDGVLQACILRSARPKELAYGACDVDVSEQMLGILMHAIPGNSAPESGEALPEFMIALLTRRLTLHSKHLQEFCGHLLKACGEGSSTAVLIAEYLIAREQGEI